jgi:protein phosphatase
VTTSPNHTPSETRIPPGEIIVRVYGRTDVGRTRDHNEDAFVVADLTSWNPTLRPEVRTHVTGERGTLFMVADGMGGAAAGELASSMAVDVVLEELRGRWCGPDAPSADAATFASALRAATEAANHRIHEYAADHPENRGMGTTATIAGLLGDTLYVAQVGDSRAYLIRDGVARQITKDQSLMQKLIEAGEITAEEAEVSDRRNIILQALGPEPNIRTDLTRQQVRRGDTLILCSDGLSGQVRPEEIAHVVNEVDDPVTMCKHLIDMANATGGPDNITVIAARFDGDGLELADAADEVGHQAYGAAPDADDPPDTTLERYVHRSQEIPAAKRPTPPAMSEIAAVDASPSAAAPRDSRRAYLAVLFFAVAVVALYLAFTRL